MRTPEQVQEILRCLAQAYPADCSLQYQKDYELLFAVRLAAQCTDERVNQVTPVLYARFPTLEAFAAAEPEDVEPYVHSCGFYRAKARDIVLCARRLVAEYDGRVPDTMEALTSLPGVGRKTANLILGDVYHKPAVVVDTHCIRLSNRMGLVDGLKDPVKIETALRKILPPEESSDFCHRLVLHGRAVCTARKADVRPVLRAPRVPDGRGGGRMKPIARIRSDFATKFGIPRQSGIVESLQAEIVFEPEFRSREAVRGLDGYSHIWLIWEFSENVDAPWSPTVRPPRLGGNVRMGVFATRSPFRPNPIGLSCVRLERVDLTDPRGPVLHVAGADLMDGTPIYDIKPYIPYADCHAEATEGFTGQIEMHALTVSIPPELLSRFPAEKRDALVGVLAQDPRPRYQTDASRVYGLEFGGYEVKFSVNGQKMTVTDITEKDS